jgi:hypothetical protein
MPSLAPFGQAVSEGFFWVGRLTANNQYFNLGLKGFYIYL